MSNFNIKIAPSIKIYLIFLSIAWVAFIFWIQANRRWVWLGLSKIAEPPSQEAVARTRLDIDILKNHFSSQQMRRESLIRLAVQQSPVAIQEIKKMVYSAQVDEREQAGQYLNYLNTPDVTVFLKSLLHDSNESVVISTIHQLVFRWNSGVRQMVLERYSASSEKQLGLKAFILEVMSKQAIDIKDRTFIIAEAFDLLRVPGVSKPTQARLVTALSSGFRFKSIKLSPKQLVDLKQIIIELISEPIKDGEQVQLELVQSIRFMCPLDRAALLLRSAKLNSQVVLRTMIFQLPSMGRVGESVFKKLKQDGTIKRILPDFNPAPVEGLFVKAQDSCPPIN